MKNIKLKLIFYEENKWVSNIIKNYLCYYLTYSRSRIKTDDKVILYLNWNDGVREMNDWYTEYDYEWKKKYLDKKLIYENFILTRAVV